MLPEQKEALRVRLFERDGPTCCYCGSIMPRKAPWYGHPFCATIEHVLDQQHGGTHDMENLKLAHLACNNRISYAGYNFFEKVMIMNWYGHTTAAKPRWGNGA